MRQQNDEIVKNINLKISLYIDDTRSAPRDGSLLLPLKERKDTAITNLLEGATSTEKRCAIKRWVVFSRTRRHHKTKIGGAASQ